MTANAAQDLNHLIASLKDLPHTSITATAAAASADIPINGSSVLVPSYTLTDDAINGINSNKELNVTFGEGESNTHLENVCNRPEMHTRKVDDDDNKRRLKRWMQQRQRENCNDPEDWRILERYLLAEATLKRFVKTHYGYGPVIVEDLNIFNLPTPEGRCVNILFGGILPIMMTIAFVFVAWKFPSLAILAIVLLLLSCFTFHKCKCRCRCCCCCCSWCYIPKWWYRWANGSRAKRCCAYLTITAILALPSMLIFFLISSQYSFVEF
ncbi:hypothetical protein DPMN_094868 [Dreissena polymorpha]|uniref:Uncharacterized protein n=1 Tax=Dreissena polymorpha TaxID=45954 RepID=A0A9D4R385_DREPO|nr:hypothetical protein DPMN_094868 [Dreissena polymorpha]